MSSRISCWLRGHRWEPWHTGLLENAFGWKYKYRYCEQCGAMNRLQVG